MGSLCGPQPDSPEAISECVDGLAAPADGKDTLILGRLNGGQFSPLAAGDRLEMNYGDQGGQHVFVAARLYSAGVAGVWAYAFEVQEGGGTPDAEGSTSHAVSACGPGWTQTETPVFMDADRAIEGVIRLVATNQDSGAVISAEIAVAIR